MLKAIINKIAAEEQVDPFLIEDAYKDCLLQIKKTLQQPEMPKILINGFGTFRVKLNRIEELIKQDLCNIKKGKRSKESLKDKLEYLFNVRRRLKNEKKARPSYKKSKNK